MRLTGRLADGSAATAVTLNKAVWTADNGTVAEVSPAGVVTGLTAGETRIRARIGSVHAVVLVTVAGPSQPGAGPPAQAQPTPRQSPPPSSPSPHAHPDPDANPHTHANPDADPHPDADADPDPNAQPNVGLGAAQRPRNCGSRLSTKARAASRWSSVNAVCVWCVTSRSMQSPRSPVTARFRFSFMYR